MKKTLGIITVAWLAASGTAAADCLQQPRCDATVEALGSSGWMIFGSVDAPVTWHRKPPASAATVELVDGNQVQTLDIRWSIVDYVCCCPSEWHGEFADVLTLDVQPGDLLRVIIGSPEVCSVQVVVPPPHDPVGRPSASGAVTPAELGDTSALGEAAVAVTNATE